jgi:hypothetical protein
MRISAPREVNRTSGGHGARQLSGTLWGSGRGRFISAAGRAVSVVDHAQIVREDLSGRSALAAASCSNAPRA